ncbi:MAG: prepilin peptidase [Acidimicrobiaceae bacterium]|nr:prepilin peptidase [Acidimicrobiaceae bacterium]
MSHEALVAACALLALLLAPVLNLLADRVAGDVHRRLPGRRLALEATVVAAFGAAALRIGWSATLPITLALFAGLAPLVASDLEHHLLPRRILYPAGAVAAIALLAAAAGTGEWRRLVVAALCGVGAFAMTWVVHAANPRWLGFGDVRLSGLIGVTLGWQGVSRVWLGLVVADLAGLAVMGALIASGRARRDTAFPFGAFLAAGAVVAALV